MSALRACGIALAGASSLLTVTPVPASLPDVHIPAIVLTAGTGLPGAAGGLIGLTSPLTTALGSSDTQTGLLSGLQIENMAGGLDHLNTALGAPTDSGSLLTASSATSPLADVVTPYLDLFTHTLADLHAIGAERLADPAPILSAILANQAGYVEQVLANPASIGDIPGEIAGHAENVFAALVNPLTITIDYTSSPNTIDITFGVPLELLLVEPSFLLGINLGAVKTIVAGLTSGDPTTALAALIDAPATLVNGVLDTLFLPDTDFSATLTGDQVDQLNPTLIELGTNPISAGLGITPFPTGATVDATAGPFGGLVDILVNYVPQQIGAAVSTTLADQVTPGTVDIGADIVSYLSGLLSGAASDLWSTMAADLGAQLPSLLMDPLALLP
ncbi:hypothetical protein [Mycobacterium botniense]|uniref:PE-PGRS family protein n=1 Tax=Mycobacterium botniense TaxID=84962 RepID=A0A7I9XV78_9MYCO|nr:hypothetical protein [Mycobacterium botniense]GFG73600.1 hypothetical protein MBOT_09650 [Mycobacterium botniense]